MYLERMKGGKRKRRYKRALTAYRIRKVKLKRRDRFGRREEEVES